MRCIPSVAIAAALLLDAGGGFVYAKPQLDFSAATGQGDSPPVGTVSDGVGSASIDASELVFPGTTTATSLAPYSTAFDSAGSVAVGIVGDGLTSAPTTSGEANDSTSASATDRYTLLPPVGSIDLQGFPFLSPVVGTATPTTKESTGNATMTAAVALDNEDDGWRATVCSGRKASCLALPATSGSRRLGDDSAIDPQAIQKAMDEMIASLAFDTVSGLAENFITSGLLLVGAMAFSFALDLVLPSFADEWEKVTNLLKVQAEAVMAVAIKAAVDMSFINERAYLIQANQKANAMVVQRLSYGTDLSLLCNQDGGAEARLAAYFYNAPQYRKSLKAYCGADRDCVVKGGVLYVKSVAQPYSNAVACMYHRDKDTQKVKAKGVALLTQAQKLATDFLNDSEVVRDKILQPTTDDPSVKTVDEHFATLATLDQKGAQQYVDGTLTKSFAWLDFKVVVSDSASTLCDGKYRAMQYGTPRQDKGVGMLASFASAQSVVLMWKQTSNKDAKFIDEILSTSKAADARSDEITKQCGDTLYGMALVSVHGESADFKPRNPFDGANIRRDRRLVQTYECGGYRLVAVCGQVYQNTTYEASPIQVDDTMLDGVVQAGGAASAVGTDVNPQVVSDYFNTYADDQKSLQDLVTDFGTEEWVRGMALRDPAVLAYAELGLGLINEVTKREVKQIDHVSGVLDETHQAQVTALTGVNNKLIETHGQEMSGLKTMENDMTKYHREEIKVYDTIDTHVAELGAMITQGFSDATSKVGDVEAAVTGKLGSLNELIGATAQETRNNVVGFLRDTTQQTMTSLDKLEGHINRADAQTLQSVGQVRDLIVETQTKLRDNIAAAFRQQEVAFQNGATDAAQLVEQVGQRVLHALLYDVDMVNNALTQQLDGIGDHVDVVKGRLVAVEKGFDDLRLQVDKMLTMLGTIQQRTNRIFRTLQNFPQKVAAILLEGEVKTRLDDFKKLNYAFTRFVENGMRPLYRAEMAMACDDYSKAGDLLYYFTSNVGVDGGMDAVVKHFRKFEFNRGDYEKFGGQTIVAAYGVQRLSLTCAYLKEDLTREQYIQRATLWDKEIDAAMYRFQMNVEEVIPRFFLTQYYTPTVLQGYLADAKLAAGVSDAATSTSTGEFSLGATEQLRYRIQQDVGMFASVSVIQVQDKRVLRVWTKLPSSPDRAAQNRQGVSLQLANAVILWSNAKKQIPADLLEQMKVHLKADDLASEDSLGAAFRGTVWERYWASGAVQSVVFTDKVAVAGSAKACPWAISSAHFPLCWETTLADADEPRSSFLITSSANATSLMPLSTNEMLGAPSNRISFAACMTSASPAVACDVAVAVASGGALRHQPPPQYKRCVADKANAYSIVYAADASARPPFITAGLSVTDEMFRTLELGATLPQISFFDEPNGAGNYVVCKNCVMADFKTVYMFRIMSFKIGRPLQEKDAVCTTHPRLKNVEYCPRGDSRAVLWTSQVLVETELIKRVQQIGDGIAQGTTGTQTLASLVDDGVQQLLQADFAFFKVYVAKTGSFNATTNSGAYWSSLPTEAAALERGWTVVPAFYTTVAADESVLGFDALIMWSTLPVEARNFAKLVVDKKPAGQSLKAYLQSTFVAYDQEKILRGFFSEPFDGLDCPVAGDTDHFAYCTSTPVDKTCMSVQLEDLPEEYTELYDGSAPNGKVLSFPLDAEQTAYVVGRSKGPFSLGKRVPVGAWGGQPMRNVSERSVCVSDYNHPELGASCIAADGDSTGVWDLVPTLPDGSAAASSGSSGVVVGGTVDSVSIEAPTWNAQCAGCSGEFVTQILQQGGDDAAVRVSGFIGGGQCRNAFAQGGGVLTLCFK